MKYRSSVLSFLITQTGTNLLAIYLLWGCHHFDYDYKPQAQDNVNELETSGIDDDLDNSQKTFQPPDISTIFTEEAIAKHSGKTKYRSKTLDFGTVRLRFSLVGGMFLLFIVETDLDKDEASVCSTPELIIDFKNGIRQNHSVFAGGCAQDQAQIQFAFIYSRTNDFNLVRFLDFDPFPSEPISAMKIVFKGSQKSIIFDTMLLGAFRTAVTEGQIKAIKELTTQ